MKLDKSQIILYLTSKKRQDGARPYYFTLTYGGIAQLGERQVRNL